MSAFLPTADQLACLAALLLVCALFVAIGAAVGGRERLRAADLPVGWAVVTIVFTAVGTLSRLPFRRVAVWTAVLACLAVLFVLWRDRRLLPTGAWRILAVMVPLFALTASMQASQWDEFAQWLPSARYLVQHDGFPRADRAPSDSLLPAQPDALPLVTYLASRVASRFAEFAGAQFDLLLLAAFALALAGLTSIDADEEGAGPGWGHAAAGVLGATLLCPTFIPKLALTSYADTATAAAVAFAGFVGWRLVEAADEPRVVRALSVQLALLLCLLLLLKQGNLALFVLLLAGIVLAMLRQRPIRLSRIALVLVAALPASAIYAVWRAYVGHELGDGAVALQGFGTWHWEALPRTLGRMAGVAMQKNGFFGLALVLACIGIGALFRPATAFGRLCLIFGTLFFGYTAFLAISYIAVLLPWEGERIGSYWRYNTHLGLLATALAGYGLAKLWRRRLAGGETVRRVAGALAIAIALTGPAAFAHKLRFDLHPVKLYLRAVAPEMRRLLPQGALLAALDPRGDGFYALFLDYLLGSGSQVTLSFTSLTAADAVAIQRGLEAVGATHVWIHTQSAATRALFPDLGEAASHLLARSPDGGWHLVRSWPFPGYADPIAIPD